MAATQEQPTRFGKYTLIKKLGVGGMGRVYLATLSGPMDFEKKVVVKTIHPEFTQNPDYVQLFLNEARLGARLSHSSIAHILELGEENGTYYLVLEYVDGWTLREAVKAANKTASGLKPSRVAEVVARVCEGLYYAHGLLDKEGKPLGVVHRDLSPQNIMVSREGDVKIIDFGVSRSDLSTNETVAGVIKGKLAYMSPEQSRGEKVDARSDIFALGILMYEALTGDNPFDRDSIPSTLDALNAFQPPPLQQFDSNLGAFDAILRRCLEKEKSRRYPDARELRMDLLGIMEKTRSGRRDHLGYWMASVIEPPPIPPPSRLADFPPERTIAEVSDADSSFEDKTAIDNDRPAFAQPAPVLRAAPLPSDETVVKAERPNSFVGSPLKEVTRNSSVSRVSQVTALRLPLFSVGRVQVRWSHVVGLLGAVIVFLAAMLAVNLFSDSDSASPAKVAAAAPPVPPPAVAPVPAAPVALPAVPPVAVAPPVVLAAEKVVEPPAPVKAETAAAAKPPESPAETLPVPQVPLELSPAYAREVKETQRAVEIKAAPAPPSQPHSQRPVVTRAAPKRAIAPVELKEAPAEEPPVAVVETPAEPPAPVAPAAPRPGFRLRVAGDVPATDSAGHSLDLHRRWTDQAVLQLGPLHVEIRRSTVADQAVLSVSTKPWSIVSIDGVSQGKTPVVVPLSETGVRLELIRPGMDKPAVLAISPSNGS